MKTNSTSANAPNITLKAIVAMLVFLLTNVSNLRATDLYWVGGTGNWSDYSNHWATSSGGTTFHFTTPGPNDDVYFDANSFPASNDTVFFDVVNAYCKSFDWTDATNNPTFQATSISNNLNVYGSFILNPLMTINNVMFINLLSSQSNNFIKAYDRLYNNNAGGPQLRLDNPTGEWRLSGDIKLSNIGVASLLLRDGTFRTDDFNISCEHITIGGGTTNPKTSLFGTSTIACQSLTIQKFFTHVDFDSSTIIVSTGALSLRCDLANVAFNIVNAGSGTVEADSCSFNMLQCQNFRGMSNTVKSMDASFIRNESLTGQNNLPPNHFQKVAFPNGGTISGGSVFDTIFVSSNALNITPNISGIGDTVLVNNQFIMNQPSGQIGLTGASIMALSVASGTVCLHNVALQNINATGGAQFFAGQGCVDAGGNTGWTFAPCSITSDVWPGDADYDLTVNNLDVLNIGLAYGDTGAVRAGASNNFVAQPCTDWNNFFQSAVNHKHADCNGDGMVDANDTTAITLNYGQNHPARYINPNNPLTTPPLYVVVSPDSAGLSDTVNVDIFLGTAANPVDSIYGIAFTLNFDTTYIDSSYISYDYTGTWMGTPGVDLLTYNHPRFLDGAVDMTLVRTDHQNISGYGFIERLGIVVVDNIGARITTPFTLSNVRAITASEYELTINTSGDSLLLDTTALVIGINEADQLNNMVSVYPNPAKDKLTIRSAIKMNNVEIYNSVGEMVMNEKINSNMYSVNINNLEQGFYLIRCITDKGIVNKRMVVAGKE